MSNKLQTIVKEHEDALSPGELQDVLTAIEVIKANGNHGSVRIDVDNSGVYNIATSVKKTPAVEPSAPMSDDVKRWPKLAVVKPT
jgi:hypothetical protein